MFVVTIETDDGEWIGTAVLNGDQQAEHKTLTEAAEAAGLSWSSTRPESYTDLLTTIKEL